MSDNYPQYRTALEGFREYLNDNNIRYEIELSETVYENDNGKSLAVEIGEFAPDLIFTVGTRALHYINSEFKDIPIVCTMALNGNSLEKNVAGVTFLVPVSTQFSILKQIVPGLNNIGVIYSEDENSNLISDAERAARRHGLNLVKGVVKNEREVPGVLRNLVRVSDAIWMIIDSATSTRKSHESIILEGYRNNIPVVALAESIVRAGASFAISADFRLTGFQSGEIALRILRGVSPNRIGLVAPDSIIVYVNGKVTDDIGISQPEYLGRNYRIVIK